MAGSGAIPVFRVSKVRAVAGPADLSLAGS